VQFAVLPDAPLGASTFRIGANALNVQIGGKVP
jgi:hypothetical protein